jgi:hypothetical protein
MFFVHAGLWGRLGCDASRTELMIGAGIQIGVAALGLTWLVLAMRRQGTLLDIPWGDRALFGILAVWIAMSILAAVGGLLARHPIGYLLGDLYKFLLLPVVFILMYLSVRTEADLDFMLRALVILYGGTILVDFVRYYPYLAQGNRFTTSSVDLIAKMAPLILYTFYAAQPWVFHVLLAAVFVETLLALSWGQTLGGFAGYLLCLGLLFALSSRRAFQRSGLRARVFLALIVMVVATFVVNLQGGVPMAFGALPVGAAPTVPPPCADSSPFVAPTVRTPAPPTLATPAPSTLGTDAPPAAAGGPLRLVTAPNYIRSRVTVVLTGGSIGTKVDVLSGSRGGEIAGVLGSMARFPARSVLGFGLGGTLTPVPLGTEPMYWSVPKHYIHAGLFEVLYRSGLVGFAAMGALLAVIFARGVRLFARDRHPFGVFVMTNVVVQTVLLAYDSSLMSPYFQLALSFAGTCALERRGTA